MLLGAVVTLYLSLSASERHVHSAIFCKTPNVIIFFLYLMGEVGEKARPFLIDMIILNYSEIKLTFLKAFSFERPSSVCRCFMSDQEKIVGR